MGKLKTTPDKIQQEQMTRILDLNNTEARQFFLKEESSFSRIERHGTNPKNYTWEVYDKSGTKYTYNQLLDGPMGAPASNAGKWYLTIVKDINDNAIWYYNDTYGGGNGTEMRFSRITYSMHPDSNTLPNGYYAMTFYYNNEQRPDAHFNYRYGFKEFNASRLDSINIIAHINEGDVPERSYISNHEIQYKFNYSTGYTNLASS